MAILRYGMIRVNIDKHIERRFRELAMKKFGYGKGALSKAAEEAILRWINSVDNEEIVFEEDPVEAIDGLLSDIDIGSVELQHKAIGIWIDNLLKNVSN